MAEKSISARGNSVEVGPEVKNTKQLGFLKELEEDEYSQSVVRKKERNTKQIWKV